MSSASRSALLPAYRTFRKDAAYWTMLIVPAVFLATCYLTPVALVMVRSFTEPVVGLGNYASIAASPAIRAVLGKTAYICIVTTTITLFLGYCTAYAMMGMTPSRQRLVSFIVVLSFWISVLIRSFAWIVLLQRNGGANQLLMALGVIDQPIEFIRNDLGVIIGMVHYMLPYAILPIFANMQTIDRSLVPAARALGATPRQAFLFVYFPLSLPGLAGAAILVLIFSTGFYITPALLGGGKVMMIAEYISVQITETLKWGLATSLATCLMVVVLALTVAMSRFMDIGAISKKA